MFALTWKKFRRYEINGCHNQRFQEFPDFSLFFPDKCKISLFKRFNIQFNKLVLIMGSTRSVRLSTLHSSVSLAAVFLDVTQRSPKRALRDIQKTAARETIPLCLCYQQVTCSVHELIVPYHINMRKKINFLENPPGGGYSREFWIGVCREGS